MYKLKTTRKAIVNSTPSKRLFAAGYCELQFLLHNVNPVAYTSSAAYGWNFDVYDVHGITLCTGHRGMPGRDAVNVREYDDRAREIVHARGIDENERRAQLDELLREFCTLQLAQ